MYLRYPHPSPSLFAASDQAEYLLTPVFVRCTSLGEAGLHLDYGATGSFDTLFDVATASPACTGLALSIVRIRCFLLPGHTSSQFVLCFMLQGSIVCQCLLYLQPSVSLRTPRAAASPSPPQCPHLHRLAFPSHFALPVPRRSVRPFSLASSIKQHCLATLPAIVLRSVFPKTEVEHLTFAALAPFGLSPVVDLDYNVSSPILTIAAGATSAAWPITIHALNDSLPELAEALVVTVVSYSSSTAIVPDASRQLLLTINASDDPYGRFAWATAAQSGVRLDESAHAAASVNITRHGGTIGTQVLSWEIINGTGQFAQAAGFVVFGDGQTWASLGLELLDDALPEAAATYQLKLTDVLGGGTIKVATNTAWLVVNASDDPYGTVAPATTSQFDTANGTRFLQIDLNRANGTLEDVVAHVEIRRALSAASTCSAQTLLASTIQVLMPAGAARTTVHVPVPEDRILAMEHRYCLIITSVHRLQGGDVVVSADGISPSASPTVVRVAPSAAVANGRLYIQNTNFVRVTEGPADTAVDVTVRRVDGTYGSVVVALQVSSADSNSVNAKPGEDIYPLAINLTFQGTDDLEQARFYVAADDVPELQESFLIGLQALIEGVAVLDTATKRIIVSENDDARGVLAMAAPLAVVQPSRASELRVGVERLQGLFEDVSVTLLSFDGTATHGIDYTFNNASGLTLRNGKSNASFIIGIPTPATPVPRRVLTLALAPPVVGARIGANSSTLVEIVSCFHCTINASLNQTHVEEGGAVALSFVRGPDAHGLALVNWSIVLQSAGPASATPALQFALSSGQVSLEHGQVQSEPIPLVVVPDIEPEDEHAYAIIFAADGDEAPGPAENFTVAASDLAYGTVGLATLATTVAEGMTLDLGVDRSGSSLGHIRVNVSVATAHRADVILSNASVLLDPGQVATTLHLSVVADGLPELEEIVPIAIASTELWRGGAWVVVGADLLAINASRAVCNVTVPMNDDARGRFALNTNTDGTSIVRLVEGEGATAVTVSRTRGLFGTVTLAYRLISVPSGILASSDFVVANGTVTFTSQQTEAVIWVTAFDDDLPELDEDFVLVIEVLADADVANPGVVDPAGDTLNMTISGSDAPFGVATIDEALFPKLILAEPATGLAVINVSIFRRQGSFGNGTVMWQLVGNLSQLSPSGGQLDFAENVESARLALMLAADLLPEEEQQGFLQLSTPTGGLSLAVNHSSLPVVVSKSDDPYGRFEFSASSELLVGDEGSEVVFYVNRLGGRKGTIVVDWALSSSSARAGSDVQPVAGTLRFETDDFSQALTLTVIDDTEPEFAEALFINLTAVCGGAVLGARAVATLEISLSDHPFGIFDFEAVAPSLAVEEGETHDLRILRSGNLTARAELNFIVQRSDGSEAIGDVNPTRGSIVFSEGESYDTLRLTVLADGIPELEENLTVTLLPLTPEDDSAALTLRVAPNDGYRGVVRVWPASKVVVGLEGTLVNVTLERQRGLFGAVTVDWHITSNATITEADVRFAAGRVPFVDGQQYGTLSINVLADDVPELGEAFAILLSNPQGGAVLDADSNALGAWVEILPSNDVFGYFTLDTAMLILRDGQRDVSASVTRAGGAVEGQDVQLVLYTGPCQSTAANTNASTHLNSTALHFDAGSTSASLIWQLPVALVLFVGETLCVQISGVARASGVAALPSDSGFTPRASTVATALPVTTEHANGVLNLAPPSLQATEGDSVQFSVVRTAGSYGAQSIVWAVTSPNASLQVEPSQGSLNMAHGSTSAVISLVVTDDDVPELAQEWHLQLVSVSGGAVLGSDVTAELLVAASDYPHGVVSFARSDIAVASGPLGNAVSIGLTREFGREGSVSVLVSTRGITADPGMFVPLNGHTVIFADGADTASLTLSLPAITSASVPEALVALELTVGGGGVVLGNISQSNVTIHTCFHCTIALSSTSIVMTEDEDRALVLTRHPAAWGTENLSWTLTGPAVEQDFASSSGTVTFLNGQAEARLAILAVDDDLVEPTKLYRLQLVPGVMSSALSSDHANVTLLADDYPYGLFGFETTRLAVSEVANERSISIVRRQGRQGLVTLEVETRAGPGASANDFVAERRNVTFVDGEATALARVVILDDATPELNETVIMQIIRVYHAAADTPGQMVGIDPQYATLRITVLENDDARGTFGLNMATAVVNEGESLSVAIDRQGGALVPVTATLQLAPGGNLALNDLGFWPSTSVSFDVNETTQVVHIAILADGIPETAESGTLRLVVDNSAQLAASRSTLDLFVSPSDDPTGVFAFGTNASITVEEPDSGAINVTFPVFRSAGLFEAVTLSWEVRLNGSLAVRDVAASTGSLIFAPGQSSADLTIAVTADDDPEDVEILAVTLVATSSGRMAGVSTRHIVVRANDYPFGVLRLAPGFNATLSEDSTTRLVIERHGGTEGAVSVSYALTSLTASVGEDFAASHNASGRLSFAPGQRENSFALDVVADHVGEGLEWFLLTLLNPEGGSVFETVSPGPDCNVGACTVSYLLAIAPSDAYGGNFSLALSPSPSLREGMIMEVEVAREIGVAPIHLTWSIVPGTNNASTFNSTSGGLDFARGEFNHTFALLALPDGIPEVDTPFSVILSAADNGTASLVDVSRVASGVILLSDSTGDCIAHDCGPHGTCLPGVLNYSCACDAGYSGPRCTLAVDYCASAPCQNGATCQNAGGSFMCMCEAGFAGARCELPPRCSTAHTWCFRRRRCVPLSTTQEAGCAASCGAGEAFCFAQRTCQASTVWVQPCPIEGPAPQFDASYQNLTVMENAAPGTVVAVLTAHGTHRWSGNLTYRLHAEGSTDDGRPFVLDERHGTLTVAAPSGLLDRERQANYTLRVSVTDAGSPAKTTYAQALVALLDENDNAPVIAGSLPLGAVVRESMSVGADVMVVEATDADEGINAELRYTLMNANVGPFVINASTGTMVLAAPLDGARMDSYLLNISVADRGTPQRMSYAHATITVIWFEPPFINESSRVGSLIEEQGGQQLVGVVKAVPRHDQHNRSLTFSIRQAWLQLAAESRGVADSFAVDDTGAVYANLSVDRDVPHNLSVVVAVTDFGLPSKTSEVVMFVRIIDVNDNAPVLSYQTPVAIGEEVAIGAPIMMITATDADEAGTQASELSFSIVSAEPSGLLVVNTSSGVISTRTSLADINVSSIQMQLRVQDNGSPMLSSQNNATVEIVRFGAPIFSASSYAGAILENATLGTFVLALSATAQHDFSNQTVTFAMETSNAPFRLIQINASHACLEVAAPLDREVQSEYTLVVSATDAGPLRKRNLASVVIELLDVNDHAPVVLAPSRSVAVREEQAVNTSFAVVQATDADVGINAVLLFEVISSVDLVEIDASSGSLWLRRALRGPSDDGAIVRVAVSDGGSPARRTVAEFVLNVTWFPPPSFVPPLAVINWTALENLTVGAVLGQMQAQAWHDGANQGLTYALVPPVPSQLSIAAMSGVVALESALDRELTPEVVFTVLAQDHGPLQKESTQQVRLLVLDVNDNAPIFETQDYAFVVREEATPNAVVGVVSANDRDLVPQTPLEYTLLNGTTLFALGARTGQLTVSTSLASASPTNYTLVVAVTDGLFTSTTNVVVGVVWFPPPRLRALDESGVLRLAIPEDAPLQAVVTQLSASVFHDGLNQSASFELNDGAIDSVPFIVAETALLVSGGLDRETTDEYAFDIKVQDYGPMRKHANFPVVVTLTDVNDCAPVFLVANATVVLREGPAYVGSFFALPQATDADGPPFNVVRYSLDPPSPYFAINTSTAELEQTAEVWATDAPLALRVRAFDMDQLESFLSVEVRVTAFEAPIFTAPIPARLNVSEATPSGAVIAQLEAQPQHDLVNRSVVYEQLSQRLWRSGLDVTMSSPIAGVRVEAAGQVIVADPKLDRELVDAIELRVRASDAGVPSKSSELTIHLRVTDENDNAPAFESATLSVQLREEANISTVVVHTVATDADVGLNAAVSYRLDGANASYFGINATTGMVTLTRSVVGLDDEVLHFRIIATDRLGDPTGLEGEVAITVLLVKFGAPVFVDAQTNMSLPQSVIEGALLRWNVSEATTVNTTLGELVAWPQHDDVNRQIEYVTENPALYLVGVDGGTRVRAVLAQPLDRESGSELRVAVEAIDYGPLRKRSLLELTLVVTDVNDNAPVLQLAPVVVREEATPGTVVTTLTATDADVGANARLALALRSSDGPFELIDHGNNTASLRVVAPLNGAQQDRYVLPVLAQDHGLPRLNASGDLLVQVQWFAPPVFTGTDLVAGRYELNVPEDTPVSATIANVMALAQHDGDDRRITYTLMNGTAIVVNATSGAVYLAVGLDYERQISHSAFVRAVDHGPLSKSRIVEVLLHVQDVNDNTPRVWLTPKAATVREDAPIGTVLTVAESFDADTGLNGDVRFTLDSSVQVPAEVDTISGILRLSAALDGLTTPVWNLTVRATDRGAKPRVNTTDFQLHVTLRPDLLDDAFVLYNGRYASAAVPGPFSRDPDAILRINTAHDVGGTWSFWSEARMAWQPLAEVCNTSHVFLLPHNTSLQFVAQHDFVGVAWLNVSAYNGIAHAAGTSVQQNDTELRYASSATTALMLASVVPAAPEPYALSTRATLPDLTEDVSSQAVQGLTVLELVADVAAFDELHRVAASGFDDGSNTTLPGCTAPCDPLALATRFRAFTDDLRASADRDLVIYGAPATSSLSTAAGQWQIFTQERNAWVELVLDDATPALVPASARLRFVPAHNAYGWANLTCALRQGSHSSPNRRVGYSANLTCTQWVEPQPDRPVLALAGPWNLTALPYDWTEATPITRAGDLLAFSGAMDVDGDSVGLAITRAVGCKLESACAGRWVYRLSPTSPWLVVGNGSHFAPTVLLLGAEAEIAYRAHPMAWWPLAEAPELHFAAWDRSLGRVGQRNVELAIVRPSLSAFEARVSVLRLGCDGRAGSMQRVDACGVCGGNGVACMGCDGLNGSNAKLDACGVCGGASDCVGCDFMVNSSARVDNCGVCAGSNADEDCAGICFGLAELDDCGECFGGTANVTQPNLAQDCDGVCFGSAVIDDCGLCTGGMTGAAVNGAKDCAGKCFGTRTWDSTCQNQGHVVCGEAWFDCHGDCLGNAVLDGCGTCVGGHTGRAFNLTACRSVTGLLPAVVPAGVSRAVHVNGTGLASLEASALCRVSTSAGALVSRATIASADLGHPLVTCMLPALAHGTYAVALELATGDLVGQAHLVVLDTPASLRAPDSGDVYNTAVDLDVWLANIPQPDPTNITLSTNQSTAVGLAPLPSQHGLPAQEDLYCIAVRTGGSNRNGALGVLEGLWTTFSGRCDALNWADRLRVVVQTAPVGLSLSTEAELLQLLQARNARVMTVNINAATPNLSNQSLLHVGAQVEIVFDSTLNRQPCSMATSHEIDVILGLSKDYAWSTQESDVVVGPARLEPGPSLSCSPDIWRHWSHSHDAALFVRVSDSLFLPTKGTIRLWREAPLPTRAIITETGAELVIHFAAAIQLRPEECSSSLLLQRPDTPVGTATPRLNLLECRQTHSTEFRLTLGPNATVEPGDELVLTGTIVSAPDELYSLPLLARLTVEAPTSPAAPVVYIRGPDQLSSCEGTLTLDAASLSSGLTLRPMAARWSVSSVDGFDTSELEDWLSDASDAVVHVPASLLAVNATYTFALVVRNFLGVDSAAAFHTVTRVPFAVPLVSVHGPAQVVSSEDLRLFARLEDSATTCLDFSVSLIWSFTWSIRSSSAVGSSLQNSTSSSSNVIWSGAGSMLTVPAASLTPGVTTAQLTLTANGTSLGIVRHQVQVVAPNPRVVLLQPNRTIAHDGVVVLSVAAIEDALVPQARDALSTRFSWTCLTRAGLACTHRNGTALLLASQVHIELPASLFWAGTYEFVGFYIHGARRAHATAHFTIVEAPSGVEVPRVSFVSAEPRQGHKRYHNDGTLLLRREHALRVAVAVQSSTSLVTLEATLQASGGEVQTLSAEHAALVSPTLPLNEEALTTSSSTASGLLVEIDLDMRVLQEGERYTLTVTATTASAIAGAAQLNFETTRSVIPGQLTIASHGTEAETSFELQAQGFATNTEAVLYRFGYQGADGAVRWLSTFMALANIQRLLPLGWGTNHSLPVILEASSARGNAVRRVVQARVAPSHHTPDVATLQTHLMQAEDSRRRGDWSRALADVATLVLAVFGTHATRIVNLTEAEQRRYIDNAIDLFAAVLVEDVVLWDGATGHVALGALLLCEAALPRASFAAQQTWADLVLYTVGHLLGEAELVVASGIRALPTTAQGTPAQRQRRETITASADPATALDPIQLEVAVSTFSRLINFSVFTAPQRRYRSRLHLLADALARVKCAQQTPYSAAYTYQNSVVAIHAAVTDGDTAMGTPTTTTSLGSWSTKVHYAAAFAARFDAWACGDHSSWPPCRGVCVASVAFAGDVTTADLDDVSTQLATVVHEARLIDQRVGTTVQSSSFQPPVQVFLPVQVPNYVHFATPDRRRAVEDARFECRVYEASTHTWNAEGCVFYAERIMDGTDVVECRCSRLNVIVAGFYADGSPDAGTQAPGCQETLPSAPRAGTDLFHIRFFRNYYDDRAAWLAPFACAAHADLVSLLGVVAEAIVNVTVVAIDRQVVQTNNTGRGEITLQFGLYRSAVQDANAVTESILALGGTDGIAYDYTRYTVRAVSFVNGTDVASSTQQADAERAGMWIGVAIGAALVLALLLLLLYKCSRRAGTTTAEKVAGRSKEKAPWRRSSSVAPETYPMTDKSRLASLHSARISVASSTVTVETNDEELKEAHVLEMESGALELMPSLDLASKTRTSDQGRVQTPQSVTTNLDDELELNQSVPVAAPVHSETAFTFESEVPSAGPASAALDDFAATPEMQETVVDAAAPTEAKKKIAKGDKKVHRQVSFSNSNATDMETGQVLSTTRPPQTMPRLAPPVRAWPAPRLEPSTARPSVRMTSLPRAPLPTSLPSLPYMQGRPVPGRPRPLFGDRPTPLLRGPMPPRPVAVSRPAFGPPQPTLRPSGRRVVLETSADLTDSIPNDETTV
ncbi:uncharacterized protein MONBRDRAFT_11395 [Monosiga brevicollis MX1]|uniref:GPS domain-containing protein n=1 Tax=Monosiga brevicollis TaxID=81824 RepID=A9V949_MONBE|nr:uncharacterized protein MONBRDRAFT_11395 [Monosiga brevicollis MX1]EDQ86066.1 predicted protein [Monosiga brevicollis MX1]|eukprot:XP_001749260.1 hypothetical protein [Monosiga brevicollis MX1]